MVAKIYRTLARSIVSVNFEQLLICRRLLAHLYDVVLNVPLAQARAMRARLMAPLRQWLGFCLRPPRQAVAEAFKCCLAALWRKIRVMFAGQRRVSVSHCLSAGLPYMPFRLARGRVWRGVMCRFATLYGLHRAPRLLMPASRRVFGPCRSLYVKVVWLCGRPAGCPQHGEAQGKPA